MFLIELKGSKSPETKNYLGIMLRLALKNSCHKRSFLAMCCERCHTIAKLIRLSSQRLLFLFCSQKTVVFKVSEKKFFKWYLCCDTDIIQFSFGCRFWWYIFLNGIVTKSEEKRKRRIQIWISLLNFVFFISCTILLLWDFQISEVLITIISFILW